MVWICLLCSLLCFGLHVAAEEVPVWPTAYHVRGTIYVPYDEIAEPFESWYDNRLAASRVDYYNGTVKTFQLSMVGKYGTYFKLEPVLTEIKCFKTEGTQKNKVLPQSVLPDMTGYTFQGHEYINNIKAEKWEQALSDSVYTMYLFWKRENSIQVITPLRFQQEGLDHYHIDFETFEKSLRPSPEVFKVPNKNTCIPLEDLEQDSLENHIALNFNPIKEYIEHTTSHVDEAWQSYKQKYNKQYNQEEDRKRKNIFRQNMRFIKSINRANLSYSLGINHMSDYTAEETEALTSCLISGGSFGNRELLQGFGNDDDMDEIYLPESLDWRDKGAVTPVKDQSMCGSCWTFMTTGAIEGAHFLKTKQLIPLSEQVLMDCAWNYGGKACNGATISSGFNWVIFNKGIPSTKSYGPYKEMDDFCHANKTKPSATIYRFRFVKSNATAMKKALVKFGPIGVGMNANKHFKSYKYGIFKDPKCPTKMTHTALIVGYGKMDGEEYWLVKNSWGNWWGVDGYGLVAMEGNICGIMELPVAIQT